MSTYNNDHSIQPQFISDYKQSIGNDTRPHMFIRPLLVTSDYISCIFEAEETISGCSTCLRPCRTPTEAAHGSQPNTDIMINNIIVEKN